MPFTHRNLLAAMFVGCVVVVMGIGQTANAFDGITFHFKENTDNTVPSGYWDDMYFMIGSAGGKYSVCIRKSRPSTSGDEYS